MQTVLGQNMLLRQFSGSNTNWYTGPVLFLMHTNRAKVVSKSCWDLVCEEEGNYNRVGFFFFSVR